MDNEQQAIDELSNLVMGEQPKDSQPTGETAPEEPKETPKEPDVKIDVAKIVQEQNKMMQEQTKKIEQLESAIKQKDEPTEEERLIEEAKQKLGVPPEEQMQKMQEFMAQQEKQQEFNKMVQSFEQEHPNIDLKEMGEWAEKNNLGHLLNSGDINQWNIVAKTMEEVAKVTKQPDAITPSGQTGAENTVWEKVNKGENVDDIEIGLELLKSAK